MTRKAESAENKKNGAAKNGATHDRLQDAIVDGVKAARRCGTPLVGIVTPDPRATLSKIWPRLPADHPKLVWDFVTGTSGVNEAGEAAAKLACGGEFDQTVNNPLAAVVLALKLPQQAVLAIHLANRWITDPALIQAICNLRDRFKVDGRTLLLLGTSLPLPPELEGDVVVFDEPLPAPEDLRQIIVAQHDACSLPIDLDKLGPAVEATQGLTAFQAEQVTAMSLTTRGLDLASLWERKRRTIDQCPGLRVFRDGETFDAIGGVPVIKQFVKSILAGKARPNAVVFIDEIEKCLAGARGDTSGVSQDQLGALLSYMQDHRAAGLIFVGPPGAAKSAVAKAAGNHAGIPTIQLDLGAAKGSLVGQSEQMLRQALKVITAVSNDRSLWIATCNSIGDLPPELRRRFTLGTFFFDLPDAGERSAIWDIQIAAYGLFGPAPDATCPHDRPDDTGWTGAEIRQCCDLAWRLGCSLREAADFVVPVSRSAADQIERLRSQAEGRFLSASNPGVYTRKLKQDVQPRARQFELAEAAE